MYNEARLATLLSRGYFPKELPSAFTTVDFGKQAGAIMADWLTAKLVEVKYPSKYKGITRRGSYFYKMEHSDAEVISAPKRGYERRNLHITHPVPQSFLAKELSDNWSLVQKWLYRQRYSLDKISVSDLAPRGIPEINFAAHRAKKGYITATANWLAAADITRFYPSIYTHSVPWAAYGKEKVKSGLKSFDGSFADRLDQLLRYCNRNQTIGIPVGPETSRVIAELISSRVEELFASSGHGLNVSNIDRLQDDWFIGCDTLDQAELAISSLVRSYREYGLELNGSKTFIERASVIADEQWISELGAFLSHGVGIPYGKRLAEFLSLGMRMQVAYPTKPVTNYILSVIENRKVAKSDAATVESFLLKSMALSPSSIASIARVIINLHHDTKALSISRVTHRVTQELVRHFKNGNNLECLWLLYIMRGLSIRLGLHNIKPFIVTPQSSAISLILLDMDNRGLVVGSLPKIIWAEYIDEAKSLNSGLWLLSYEGIRHGWLTDPHGLAVGSFFKPMLDRSVAFYDPKKNVPTSRSITLRRKNERQKANKETFSMIQFLRGFEEEY